MKKPAKQKELDRGSDRAQQLRQDRAGEKRVRRGERFPRTATARVHTGISRSAIEHADWQRLMANNPKAQLGGSQLGKLAERKAVRATKALSWRLLWDEPTPSGGILRRERRYQTEALALAAQKERKGSRVAYRGAPRDRFRTAVRVKREKKARGGL